jgi:outer membrane protein assembly factor BamB
MWDKVDVADLAQRLRRGLVLLLGATVVGLWAPAASARAATSPVRTSAAPTSVVTDAYDDQRTGYNPAETTITSATASGLQELWSAFVPGGMNAQPVEAADVNVNGTPTNIVYEGTNGGWFYAINATDGSLIWRRYLGSLRYTCPDSPTGVYGIGGAAAISFTAPGTGVVYVQTVGSAHSLDLATGAEEPGWPVSDVLMPRQDVPYGGVTLSGDLLYTTTSSECDQPINRGGIETINVATHSVVSTFFPALGHFGGGIWGPAGVSVEPSNGHVFAATANANGRLQNWGYSDAVVELTSGLQVLGYNSPPPPPLFSDDDFGTTPILFQPEGCPYTLVASKRKDGNLYVSAEGDLDHVLQTLQIASPLDSQFNGIPAWDPETQMLYIGNSSDSATYSHGMVALQAHSDCSLSLAWQHPAGANLTSVSPPTVAGGVVYYGDGPGGTEYAFDAATGAELWNSGATISFGTFATPMVANGELFVPSWNNHLYAFGLPGAASPARHAARRHRNRVLNARSHRRHQALRSRA